MGNGIRFKTIWIEKNSGLGKAMSVALENCSYDLVARMDSDDISDSRRFERQLKAFADKPEADVIGGYMTEFVGDPDNITGVRTVRLNNEEIRADMKKRCAMNHVCVMFRKKAVMDAGGYLDWYCNEDYYLWIRMMQNGSVFANVPYVLVNVRTGSGMSSRRGGWRYFKSERDIQKYMLDHGMIGVPRFLYNVAVRFCGEILAPGWVRSLLYRMIRKSPGSVTDDAPEAKESAAGHEPFSVIISVYGNDEPEWFDTAMTSIISQTAVPDEIVLAVDGPVPDEITEVIGKYEAMCNGS
ncbi:MAG: glycosyltransferase [Oscillospiraceae bacterium]|nr:glycosyltransferase [Oscillospiraceae bacterium]